jgi:glycosyltransferase involved in cell wall biosynthesis
MTEFPEILSVVIPTHNRSASLRRTLEAIRSQTWPASRIEVVVVADGCSDGTVEMLRSFSWDFTLRVIEQSAQGPAAARNKGAEAATGRLLIFLDDDIEPVSLFVEAHHRAHDTKSDCVVVGYMPPVIPPSSGIFGVELRFWWEAMFDTMRQPGHRFNYRDLLSGNFSLPADLFKALGGFHPDLRCHEDYEFGVRLIKGGVPLVYEPRAAGFHHEQVDLCRSLDRKVQEGRADVRLVSLHPDLLPVLPLVRLKADRSRINNCLRRIAFRFPAQQEGTAFILMRVLRLLEWLCFRRRWLRLLDRLLAFSYWKGVASELTDPRGLDELVNPAKLPVVNQEPDLEVDLSSGVETAQNLMEQRRPCSVRICYGRWLVGSIPHEPGAERLRGEHLRPFLLNRLSRPLLTVLAAEGVIDLGVDPGRIMEACALEISRTMLRFPSSNARLAQ